MMRQWNLFLCAVQFLTRIPVPTLQNFEDDWITRSARYFPLVGHIIGGLCAMLLLAATHLWPGAIPVLLALTFGILLTGAFHEDGLADTADGLGGGRDKDQRLTIMKDSRIGTYGALALGLCLALKAAALIAVPPAIAALLLFVAHGTGRAVAVVAMHVLPYAGSREAAKSKPVAIGVTTKECVVSVMIGLWPLLLLPASQAIAAMAFGCILAACIILAAHRLIGGYTGDVLGAVEQVFELGFLLGAIALI